MTTPAEALHEAAIQASISKHLFHGRDHMPLGRPGEFYERLPEDVKETLRRLTSADAANVRYDAIKNFL